MHAVVRVRLLVVCVLCCAYTRYLHVGIIHFLFVSILRCVANWKWMQILPSPPRRWVCGRRLGLRRYVYFITYKHSHTHIHTYTHSHTQALLPVTPRHRHAQHTRVLAHTFTHVHSLTPIPRTHTYTHTRMCAHHPPRPTHTHIHSTTMQCQAPRSSMWRTTTHGTCTK